MRSECHVKGIGCLIVIFSKIRRASTALLFAFKGIMKELEALVRCRGE